MKDIQSQKTSKDELLIDTSTVPVAFQDDSNDIHLDEANQPQFAPLNKKKSTYKRLDMTSVRIPYHRMSPLKANWSKIYPPLVEHLKLQVRMNLKNKTVDLRTSIYTEMPESLQKGADFIKAFAIGFDVNDAIAMIRLDDIYLDTFEIKDVKTLEGQHLSRAIGRIVGKDGKTKFAIENATQTRIVVADTKIHILGKFLNINIARNSVVSLILGSPAGKIYSNLRNVSARLKNAF
ncbi:unnamed protein product [Pneumocystis jirovecii]|uniref:Pre-rRNA-processing protein PNO1 n=2 Tax=Pneumocystis jirovecii TaxID=42068 RepID=L0PCU0_PNEJI|nr:uncharacterized protein T551_02962 [Pneumocystis jirovecii RU7]KTW27463.1 hypothetical protein T551_02962 [Pneumocystis jirovecii RU7]CCJ30221.1 unnamed protein product [Pneumocystis jirovecii]